VAASCHLSRRTGLVRPASISRFFFSIAARNTSGDETIPQALAP